MPPKRNTARKAENESDESGKYLFYADRLDTFKKFTFDKKKDAVCTSTAVARAGFYCTGPESGKCPFCLKELEFEEEDDPWAEHASRKPDCDFVKLSKLDDTLWTVEDCIRLAVRHDTMAKLEKQLEMVAALKSKLGADGLAEALTTMKIGEELEKKPPTRTSRRAK